MRPNKKFRTTALYLRYLKATFCRSISACENTLKQKLQPTLASHAYIGVSTLKLSLSIQKINVEGHAN
jgi:hypothetical protein